VGHAFDLQARLAEIQQQAELQVGRFEIIGAVHPPPGSSAPPGQARWQALVGHVRVVQCLDDLQLNRKYVLDQQVYDVVADHHGIVVHPDATLRHNR
jgi:hypothetical protein